MSSIKSAFDKPKYNEDDIRRHVTDEDLVLAKEAVSSSAEDLAREILLDEYEHKNIIDIFDEFEKKFNRLNSPYELLFTFMDDYRKTIRPENYNNIIIKFGGIINKLGLPCCTKHKNASEKEMVGNYAYIILQKLIQTRNNAGSPKK